MDQKNDEILIGLKPGIKQAFQKSVFEGKKRIETLFFAAGVAILIKTQAQFDCIADSIGKMLGVIVEEEDGTQRYCRETTRDYVVAIALKKEEEGQRLTKNQKQELSDYRKREQEAAEPSQMAIDPDEGKLADVEQRINAMQAELTGLEAKSGELEASMKGLVDESDALDVELDGAEPDRVAEIQVRKSEIDAQIETLQSEIREVHEQIESNAADISEAEQEYASAEIASLEKEVEQLSAEIEIYEDVVSDPETSKADATAAKKEISKIKSKRTRTENRLTKLKNA